MSIKRFSDIDGHASNEVESGVRASIRRDIGRRAVAEPGAAAPADSDKLSSLIKRVSVTTISEIDLLIAELQKIRSVLHSEGERVHREITGYAGLSQSAVATVSVITETLSRFRPRTVPPRNDLTTNP